ncbi:MAG: GntR family transcriptional regulator [Paracoccaceae bacterium]
MPASQPDGALPLYLQISESLIRDIASGRLADGSRLPPERDMAKSLGISIGTLRKALAELEKLELLRRIHGSGNYVRTKATPEGVYAFFRLELREGGGLPTAQVLDVMRMNKPASLPAFGTSIAAYRIRRLRMLSGKPAALEEIWLDADCVQTLDAAELSHSLYRYYREALDLWITGYVDQVSVAPCPAWAPDVFAPRPGAPCGLVERASRTRDGATPEVSRNWFDSEIACYVARMR